jgi:peptide/nickel transport system substrate-binding protein
MAAFLGGKYDLGWENPGTINRTDWVQIKDTLKKRRPRLQTAEFPANVVTALFMRTDKAPFSDVRVRQAMSMAIDRSGIVNAVYEGVGVLNPAVPTGLKEWSLPMDQLGEGARYFRYDPAAARKLLAEAGYPRGFSATADFATYGSTVLVDMAQLVVKYLKDVGIDVKLNTMEYGAYLARVLSHKHDSMGFGPYTPFLEPDGFLFFQYFPGESRNTSLVNDPVAADMLVRQRRTLDPVKRREIVFEIQRYLASQQYYVQLASTVYVAVWDAALRNYGPNLGFDWGGRLMAAWLDR